MKRIIRLTESDLARIVKRVINEENNETIKIKAFTTPDWQKTGKVRALNLDLTNFVLKGTKVTFDYKTPGGVDEEVIPYTYPNKPIKINSGKGDYRCGVENEIHLFYRNGSAVAPFWITDNAQSKLSKWCDAYAQNDSEMDMMDSDFA